MVDLSALAPGLTSRFVHASAPPKRSEPARATWRSLTIFGAPEKVVLVLCVPPILHLIMPNPPRQSDRIRLILDGSDAPRITSAPRVVEGYHGRVRSGSRGRIVGESFLGSPSAPIVAVRSKTSSAHRARLESGANRPTWLVDLVTTGFSRKDVCCDAEDGQEEARKREDVAIG